MTVTVQSFRDTYAEFASSAVFPDAVIAYWIGFAQRLIDPSRFDTMYDDAVMLFVAHNVTLAGQSIAASVNGNAGPSSSGIVSAEAVSGVSVSYDTASVTIADGGEFNSTKYGRRYLQLVRMFGAGGFQL